MELTKKSKVKYTAQFKSDNLIGDESQAQFKDQHIMSTQKVGPSIADDIKIAAFWAVLFSLSLLLFTFYYVPETFRLV